MRLSLPKKVPAIYGKYFLPALGLRIGTMTLFAQECAWAMKVGITSIGVFAPAGVESNRIAWMKRNGIRAVH